MCCRYEENKLFKTLNDNLLKSYAVMEILGKNMVKGFIEIISYERVIGGFLIL